MNLRFDRLTTLYLVSPFKKLASSEGSSIPILMYHSIADEDESGRHGYYRTITSPQMFAAQMKYLGDNGYKTCTLAQAMDQLRMQTRPANRTVVVTFDDGFSDFLHHAFPVLNRHGFNATVFLPTAYIGDRPLQFKGKDCLTWAEIRELQSHGILFGSHTVTHPQLRSLNAHAVNAEIVDSKAAIEQKLGCAVESFAYPYAFPETELEFTARLRDSLLNAGYKNGVCTLLGKADQDSDVFFMERLPVNSCDDGQLFAAKLSGAYDWLAKPQYLMKMAKKLANGGRRSLP